MSAGDRAEPLEQSSGGGGVKGARRLLKAVMQLVQQCHQTADRQQGGPRHLRVLRPKRMCDEAATLC